MGKFWIIPLIITVVLANFWLCRGCWEEERFALLQLKSNINYPYGNSLPSWIDDNRSDCCEWSNIVCDTTTKRVIKIYLDSTTSYWYGIQDYWQFNASLFLPFKMLRLLSLAANWLDGWVVNQGFEKLSELSKLEGLNLEANVFNRSVLSSLSHLTSLKYLNLNQNKLGQSGGYERLSNLKRLEYLYLSDNLISESNIQTICSIANVNHLQVLHLNGLDNKSTSNYSKIATIFDSFSSLNTLYFQDNVFAETHSFLDLSCNNLTGSIPRCLGEMMTSDGLGSFNTDLTSEEIDNPMTDATDSYLETSKFAMTFHLPLATIFNNEFNIIDNQNIRAEFTTKLQAHSFQGIVLEYMSGIDLSCNQLTGNILPDLGNLSKIYALNLSHNNLTGSIPITLSGLAKIESLDLSYNKLNGRIPAQLIALNFLEVFSVAHNNLSGPIPDRKAQFATFDASSYEGNALLCGPPLSNLCTHKELSPPQVLLHENGEEESKFNGYEIILHKLSHSLHSYVGNRGCSTVYKSILEENLV
nr:leucine-rich repeat receptor-like protein kinase PEPR2 [Ipomoea batatas]